MTEQGQFFFKVDGTDFEFDTAETGLHLRFYLCQHLIVISHPYKAVDGYSGFSTGES